MAHESEFQVRVEYTGKLCLENHLHDSILSTSNNTIIKRKSLIKVINNNINIYNSNSYI